MIVMLLMGVAFFACEKDNFFDESLTPDLPKEEMPAEKVLGVSFDEENAISKMLPMVQELIAELETWDKTYGILPQLNNILRKLEKGDLDNANVKLEALLEHLNELLVDPDGPIYGNEEAEAQIRDLIEKVKRIYQEGTICWYIVNWLTDVQIIYAEDELNPENTFMIIRVRNIDPETIDDDEPGIRYSDFRLHCLDELYDIPECVYAILSEEDLELINSLLDPCG